MCHDDHRAVKCLTQLPFDIKPPTYMVPLRFYPMLNDS
jgi:hypothetical protein